MEKFCQSCAMPLNEQNQGSEKDGSKSGEYCYLCYVNGAYTNPNITFNEMKELGERGIEQAEGSKIKKWFLKKSYPSLLKKMKRWS